MKTIDKVEVYKASEFMLSTALRASLWDQDPRLDFSRYRRSMAVRMLLVKWLGKDADFAVDFLVARGVRMIMADIIEGKLIPVTSIGESEAIKYIEDNLSYFIEAFEYILYGDARIERAWTTKEFERTMDWENTKRIDMLKLSLK